ncbi:hypothetical protein FGG08_004518 [Glutinoglossum americanum]|uniref:Uncharacterized protein n=1 Tax=Glutinoglossum americanum TaxID=1670608 RepID=A0A9P8I4Y7_9PEZI|nr:hypothetical protein FGG08_004518 [Glutinoglossum americanum]
MAHDGGTALGAGARSYGEYVHGLSHHWRFLQRLDCFMNPDLAVVLKSPVADEVPQERLIGPNARHKKIDIVVLDILDGVAGGPRPGLNSSGYSGSITARFNNLIPGRQDYDDSTSDELRSFLTEEKPSNVRARLYLVEDLSSDVVEILGSTFKLDPNFFAYHIRRCRTHYVELTRNINLSHPFEGFAQFSDAPSRPYFHLEFRRSYRSVGPAIFHPQSVIVRSVELAENVSNVKEKVSVWTDIEVISGRETLTGIFLFDSAMNAPFLSSGEGKARGILYPKFPATPFEALTPGIQSPLRADYVDTLLSNGHQTAEVEVDDIRAYVLYFVMSRTIAEWSHFADLIEKRLVLLEEGLNTIGSHNSALMSREEPKKGMLLATALKELSFLRTQSQGLNREMTFVASVIRGRLKEAVLHQGLGADLVRLQQMGKSWENRTAAIHATIVAWLSIQEGKLAVEQGESLAKLTLLGFVFVPLGCVATVMSVGTLGSSKAYWIYVLIAVPLTAFTILVGGHVGEMLRKGKRRIGGRGGKLEEDGVAGAE